MSPVFRRGGRNRGWQRQAAAFGSVILAATWVSLGHATVPPAAAPAAGCTVSLASPLLVPLATVPGDVVIDDACRYVYLTNTIQNRVEVFSLQTLSLEEPIQVGAQPVGLDVTPDGTFLYVANSGGSNFSVVDLAKRVEARRINLPYVESLALRPWSMSIASNGRGFFTTTANVFGYCCHVMQIDLATDQLTRRTDVGFNSSVTERSYIRRSHDRSSLAFLAPGDRLFLYQASANSFVATKVFTPAVNEVGLDQTGAMLFLTSPGYVLDAGLHDIGTVSGGTGSRGAAVDPGGRIAYRAIASRVEFLDLVTLLKTGEVTIPDTITGSTAYANAGRTVLSGDGKLLAVTTSTGFVLARVQ